MRFIDRRRPTGRLIARASAVLAGVGILLVVAAPAASAHAVLESTTPTQAAVLTTAPTEVDLRFDESVEVALGAIRVLDSNGNRVDVGAAHHPNGSGRDVAVGLRSGLTNGTYLVSWRVISADSHPVGGTFTFSIGHAGAVASVASSSGDHTVAVLFVVARFLGYAGLVVFVGGWLFTLLCRPPRTRALVGLTTIGWTTGLVGDVGALLLQGPYGAALPLHDTFNWTVLHAVLGTRFGYALQVRLIAWVVAGITAGVGVRQIGTRQRASVALTGAAVLGIALSFAAAGHGGVGVQWPLALASDVVHLLSVSTWLGGLLALVAVTLRRAGTNDVAAVVTRFSRLAGWLVLAIVVTGVYAWWRQAGILSDLPVTAYGRLLLLKVSFVAVAWAVAMYSRSWVRRPTGTSTRRLRISVGIEALAGVAVLVVTTALVAAPSARASYRPSFYATVVTGPLKTELWVVPDGSRLVDIHLLTTHFDGTPAPVPEVDLSMSLPSRQIGAVVVPLQKLADNHYEAARFAVPLAGRWTLKALVRTTDIDEYTATTVVVVR